MLCVISQWLKAFTICLLEWSICLIICCIMSGKNLWDTCALLCVICGFMMPNVCVCAFCRYTWVPWWYLHQPGANGGGCSLAHSVCTYLYHLLFLFNILHSSLKLYKHLKSLGCVFHSSIRAVSGFTCIIYYNGYKGFSKWLAHWYTWMNWSC